MKNKIFKPILSFLALIVSSMNVAIAQCGSELPIVIYVNDASLATVQFSIFDDNNTLLLQGDADEIEEIFCLPEGCYTITVSGLSCTPINIFGNSGCIPNSWSLNANDNFITSGNNGTESFCLISGCTDYRHCNYNPEATIEDGSCEGIPGCTDNTACNFQPFADCDNGTCSNEGEPFSFTITDNTGGGLVDAQWVLYGYDSERNGYISPDPDEWQENLCLLPGCYVLYVNNIPEGHDVVVAFGDFESGEIISEQPGAYVFSFGGIAGCNDPVACNYNPNAMCDAFGIAQCLYPGCTNPQACNYESNAGCNDGSCILSSGAQVEVDGSTCHLTVTNSLDEVIYDQDIQGAFTNPNIVQYLTCLPFECLTFTVTGLSCYELFPGIPFEVCEHLYIYVNGNLIYDFDADDGISETQTICITQGCTDAAACNYDAEATTDDGSCGYIVGCTEPNAVNYNPNAICDDGNCVSEFGCTNPIACNYNLQAGIDDGSCDLLFTMTAVHIVNTNSGAANPVTITLTSDAGIIYSATVAVGSVLNEQICLPFGCFTFGFTGQGVGDVAEFTTSSGDIIQLNGFGTACFETGCTDPAFCNYDPFANVDDGSCCNSNPCTAISFFDGGNETLNGAMYNIYQGASLLHSSTAHSVDEWYEAFCLADGCYSLEIIPNGVGNPISWNIDNAAATQQSGSGAGTFSFVVGALGCTDPTACNYNINATCDDGTCNYGSPLIVRVTNLLSSPAVINFEFRAVFNGPIIASGSALPEGTAQDYEVCVPEQCMAFSISGLGAGDFYQIGTMQNNVFVQLMFTHNGGTINTPGQVSCCFIYGCTSNTACNPNSGATVNDGSCLTDCDYCVQLEMIDDGTEGLNGTHYKFYFGNFLMQEATSTQIDEFYSGLCVPEQSGCYTLEILDNGNNAGLEWSLSDGDLNFAFSGTGPGVFALPIFGPVGCTEENAANYDDDADCDDGSCNFPGCIDSAACNFDSSANQDDGTCQYGASYNLHFTNSALSNANVNFGVSNELGATILTGTIQVGVSNVALCLPDGCNQILFSGIGQGDEFTITHSENGFEVLAGSYQGLSNLFAEVCVQLTGCTNPEACNFIPTATIDDGSCATLNTTTGLSNDGNGGPIQFILVDATGQMIAFGSSVNGQNTIEEYCLTEGCYEIIITGMVPGVLFGDMFSMLINGELLFGFVGANGTYAFCIESGCTDINACNYSVNAYYDDGSCAYTPSGCSDPAACNFTGGVFCVENCVYSSNAVLTIINGSTANVISYTISDIETLNVLYQGTTTTNLVLPICLGANCYNVQVGGMQITSPVSVDFWELEFEGNEVASGNGSNPNESFCIVSGCTDINACNYNPEATFDDGSCDESMGIVVVVDYAGNASGQDLGYSIFHGSTTTIAAYLIDDESASVQTQVYCIPLNCYTFYISHLEANEHITVTDFDGNVLLDIEGPVESGAFSFCPGLGCTDVSACNYDVNAIVDDGSCLFGTSGCTDSFACNYDSNAVCYDGSCVYPGCTDVLACNYNASAACDDGSCLLEVILHINNFNPPSVTYNLFHPTTFVQYMTGFTPANQNFNTITGCIPDECLTLDIHGLTSNDVWSLTIGGATIANGNTDGIFNICQHDGCKALAACNYDPAAVHDDGSCFFLVGDFDGNLIVNTGDLLLFMSGFGCSGSCAPYDLDGNGVTNTGDLLLFMSFFGSSC